MRRTLSATLAMSLIAGGAAIAIRAQTPAIDAAMNARIRAEVTERSQILKTLHYLTDVHGPRLTGSPAHEAAAKWATAQLTEWGAAGVHLDPWNFGRDGWQNIEASGHLVAPVQDNLVFEVVAWTPSTNGVVIAPAVSLVTPVGPSIGTPGPGSVAPRLGPTVEELDHYFAEMAPKVRGAIVLVGAPLPVPFEEFPQPKRRDDAQMRRQFTPDPNARAPMHGARGNGPGGRGGAGGPSSVRNRLTGTQVATRVNEFLVANGAAVRLGDAGLPAGQIRAFAFSGYDVGKTVPTVVLRSEDFGRVFRLLSDDIPVTMKFDITNRVFPEGRTSYNVLAEIPGTDLADEVVMLGAHLDSWHSATGATDNAIGCAVMMEAIRVIEALGVRPRRTIRLGLWSGEEQGLLGSRAYVSSQFGSADTPTAAFNRLEAYLNLDTGTGRVRGAVVYGPPSAAAIIGHYLAQFEDRGVYGATSTMSRLGGTDSGSFTMAGLPGINFLQDPIEYLSETWHTNLDTYERILEEDAQTSAMAIASTAYHLAMRDERLPRATPSR